MMYSLLNGRSQRGRTEMYNPILNPYANYCTEALQKSEMKLDYENEIFINNLHLIPDPLKKNLADTLITAEMPEKVKKQSLDTPTMPQQPKDDSVRPESALAGITNFFSGVFSMLSGAVFRTKSPVDYYDCFDDGRQGSPLWQSASSDVQDKNGLAVDKSSTDASPDVLNMNKCKTTVTSCEDKLNQVKCLLSPKENKPNPIWLRKRPKKVFVEASAVEDRFEDAFTPEDFVAISNELIVQCICPPRVETEGLCETEAPKTKLEVAPMTETKKNATEVKEKEVNEETKTVNSNVDDKVTANPEGQPESTENNTEDTDDKHQLVTSCEDKLSKLKVLLQEKRKPPTIIEPTPEPTEPLQPTKTIPINKSADKHYKNTHRMLDKRRKMKMKRNIQDDVLSSHETDNESPINSSPATPSTNSSDTTLGEYFDELKGRFRTTSATESEDSFQIVFNDSPKSHRASDCESDDSFIVFEDECYTTNDVFGDSGSDSEVSDSGCSTMTCKLSHSLSRTVSNLTDDTLFESGDEVDCAKVEEVESKGLLIDARKKNLRIGQPPKKVTFSAAPPQVKVMRVWAFAARMARPGHWERYVLDRDRFKRRINDVEMSIAWVLKPQHRARVMFQRIMPWRNRERRRELAEKKEREEKKKEEERLAEEKRIAEEKELEEAKEKNGDVGDVGDESGTKNEIDEANTNVESETLFNVEDKSTSKNVEDEKKLKGDANCDVKTDVSKMVDDSKNAVDVIKGKGKGKIESNNNKILATGKINVKTGKVATGKCS